MIDSDLKVWLIEINCSPAMDASTKVRFQCFTSIICPVFMRFQITERLCAAALKVCLALARACYSSNVRSQDIVKLVVDEGDTTFRRKPKLPDVEPDTGSNHF